MKPGATHLLYITYALLLGVGLCGLGACDSSTQEVARCPEAACEAGAVCLASTCVAETSDPDGDGLETAIEMGVGLDPLSSDTDVDGLSDGMEWGSGVLPRDRDSDGIPDALESQDADGDGDCVPDVWDALPDEASQAPSGWVDALCSGLGVCGLPGAQRGMVCAGGVALCSVSGGLAFERSETLCDGLDNDCDGFVDETLWWNNAPVGSACWGAGECGLGHVECNPTTLEPTCSTLANGSDSAVSEEVCDGLDNNCDGLTDEGITFGGALLGEACTGKGQCGQGVVVCEPQAKVAICSSMPGGDESEATVEVCDGEDNDCDGFADEEVAPPAVSGCPSKGVCAKPGSNPSMECVEGEWICVFAGVESYEPGYERTCDSLDNDCDGYVDEEFALLGRQEVLFAGDSCGLGPCSGGVVLCAFDGNGVVCSTASNASTEVCDGVDNDCDGIADNGQTYQGKSVGEPCKGVGACGAGVVACRPLGGEATCSTNPGMPGSQATAEVCDLQDNDCDGTSDDGLGAGPSCLGSGVCAASDSLATCVAGQWHCDYTLLAGFESSELSCDGVDNDCDGRVDEGTDATFLGATVVVRRDQPAHRTAYVAVADATGVSLVGGVAGTLDGDSVCLGDWWRQDGDGNWSLRDSDALPARHDAAAALRPQGDGVVVLGGRCGEDIVADGWLLSGDGATAVAVPSEVASRYGHALFAEAEKGDWLVVGGKNELGEFAGTWSCTAEWQCSGPLPGFPSVMGAASCVDPLANRAYLFGGERPDGTFSGALVRIDLLTLQAVSFELPSGPSGRVGASLLCRGDTVYLVGGLDQQGETLGDTWIYSVAGQQWAEGAGTVEAVSLGLLREVQGNVRLVLGVDKQGRVNWGTGQEWQGTGWGSELTSIPTIGVGAASAYDPYTGASCVNGGVQTTAGAPLATADVWCRPAWGDWSLVAELSSAAVWGSLVYDPYRDRYLVFGGLAPSQGLEGEVEPCRAEWFNLAGEQGTLAQCELEEGPSGFAGAVAILAPDELQVYLLGGRTAAEGASLGLWTLDLESEQWSWLPLPAPLASIRIVSAIWDEGSQALWVLGQGVDGLALVQWHIGELSVGAVIPVGGAVSEGALWHDSTSSEFLLLGSDGDSYLLFDNGGTLAGFVPAALEGVWPAGRMLTWQFSQHRREAQSLGLVNTLGLTQPTEMSVTMKCQ